MQLSRPILNSDLPEVAQLALELGYPATIPELSQRLESLRASGRHEVLGVTDSTGKIRGWIHLEEVLDLVEKNKAEVKALVVDKESQGQGLGRSLIQAARVWAKSRKLGTIYLSCNILRTGAHQFYKREGFALAKTSHFFELNL